MLFFLSEDLIIKDVAVAVRGLGDNKKSPIRFKCHIGKHISVRVKKNWRRKRCKINNKILTILPKTVTITVLKQTVNVNTNAFISILRTPLLPITSAYSKQLLRKNEFDGASSQR